MRSRPDRFTVSEHYRLRGFMPNARSGCYLARDIASTLHDYKRNFISHFRHPSVRFAADRTRRTVFEQNNRAVVRTSEKLLQLSRIADLSKPVFHENTREIIEILVNGGGFDISLTGGLLQTNEGSG